MLVKRYEANSLEEALAQVKRELGPEALILSTQQKKGGWLKSGRVEVMAAKETAAAAKAEAASEIDEEALKKIFPHRRDGENESLEDVLLRSAGPETADKSIRHTKANRYQEVSGKAVPKKEDTSEVYVESLSRLGFSDISAKEIARRMIFDYPKEDRADVEALARIRARVAASGIQVLNPSLFDARTVWTAIGVGGAGKTASLVKLAISLKRQKYSVSLVGCDHRKVVGQRELAAYARLIQTPYSSEFRIERGPRRVQLIDTPALSFQSPDQNAEIEEICRGTSPVLVLDATARLKEAIRIWEVASRFQPAAICFTRLDLVSQPGVLHDILKTTRLPLLGASLGDSFRTPFQWFESRTLGELLTTPTAAAVLGGGAL